MESTKANSSIFVSFLLEFMVGLLGTEVPSGLKSSPVLKVNNHTG